MAEIDELIARLGVARTFGAGVRLSADAADALQQLLTILPAEVRRLTAERDEAREVLAEIAKITAPPKSPPWQRFADIASVVDQAHALADYREGR